MLLFERIAALEMNSYTSFVAGLVIAMLGIATFKASAEVCMSSSFTKV